jgi:uncharacterized alkaline shock family protein YloU
LIKLENHLGKIEVSNAYFANLIGHAVSECFGVSGLVHCSAAKGLWERVRGAEPLNKGVRVRIVGGRLHIALHISVSYGVNIAAIVKSIVHKVTYTVEAACGMSVARVNVYIAEMKV